MPRIWVKIRLRKFHCWKWEQFESRLSLETPTSSRESCALSACTLAVGGDIKHLGLFSPYNQLHDDFWNDKRKVCSLDLTTFSITKLSRHLAMCLCSVHVRVDDTWPLQLHGYYSKLVFKTPVSRPKARHSDMKGLEIFPISWAACGTDFAMFYGIGRKYFFIERMIFPGGQVWPPPFPW